MNCPNCNTQLQQTDKFCKNCGERVGNEHIDQYNYNYNYSNQSPPAYNIYANHQDQYNYNYNYSNYQATGEDMYVKEYVGPNYDKIKNSKFSIPGFFLSAYYLLYRKLWLYAILYIIIINVTPFILDENIGSIINIVLNLIIGLKFNELYLKKAREDVDKIKNQNLDKTTQELIDLCRKKGGTSPAGPFLAIVIIFAVTFILIFANLITGSIPSTIENKEYKADLGNLTYTIPNDFEESYISENTRHYIYDSTCLISIENINVTNNNTKAEDYIKAKVYYNQNYTISQINPITINNLTWQYQTVNSTSKESTHYAIIYNDSIYYINTTTYNNKPTKNTTCNNKYNEFFTTVTFKSLTTDI